MSSSPLGFDPANPTLPGSLFAGKYRIEKILGQGGMGMVLAARHLGLDEPVAIKLLLPAMMEVPGMVERFTREARASAKIKNDHVVRVTDVDALPSGVPYMVMERLDGTDLSDLRKSTGQLPISDAVRYLIETCSAIGEAHAMGIIHRDLKPANLFLARRRDGATTIKVLDFGISKAMHSLGEQTMTVAGAVLGSPSYMSPEQIAAARDLDGRTDIWSLGVILYQLLTGKVPFPAQGLTELCALVLQTEPRRPSELRPDLPPGLEAVILRCLEKDRTRRYGSAGELATALLPFAEPMPARQKSAPIIDSTVTILVPPGAPRAPSPSMSDSVPRAPLPSTSDSLPQAPSLSMSDSIPRAPSLSMSESAPIASAVTSQRPPKRSGMSLVGLAGAIGLLAIGGGGVLWLRARPQPVTIPATSQATTMATEAVAVAPPVTLITPTKTVPIAAEGVTVAPPVATIAPIVARIASAAATTPAPSAHAESAPSATASASRGPTLKPPTGAKAFPKVSAAKDQTIDVGF